MHHSHIDRFAQGDSPIHRLDARAKFLALIAYTVTLVSFGRHDVMVLAPMSLLPLAAVWFGRIPAWFAFRRVLLLCPFILTLCLMSPLYDRTPLATAIGPWHFRIAGGWLTAACIFLKFTLGLIALTAMMSTTPFALLLEAMRRMGMPQVLTVQLGFLYRYIFVLMDESMRVRRGRDFRGAARAPTGRRLAAVGGMIGSLFVRTLERSDNIHVAMCARGYRGEPRSIQQLHFSPRDAWFLAGVAAYLILCRWVYPVMF